jgi:hypothetical protein
VPRGPKPETGNRYGRLLVISKAPIRTTQYGAEWVCLCDCGKRKIVRGASLRCGNTKSCGCLHADGANIEHALAGRAKNRAHRVRHQNIIDDIDEDSDAMIAVEFGL